MTAGVVSVFLVKDSSLERESRIKFFLDEDPTLSLILSAVHFEWTIRRAIIALGTSPNVAIRIKLRNCHGLKRYKSLWKEEVAAKVGEKGLPDVVKNWENLDKAFRLRHKLVHGAGSCGSAYARERAMWALEATDYVWQFCNEEKINLDARLPVRRSANS